MDKNFPDFPELDFEEGRHIYRLNGSCIPSVTTVMRPLSNALYRDVDEAVLNMAAERGTSIHNAIENNVLYGIEDIPDEYEGYFSAYQKWVHDMSPKPLASECKVYHKVLRYAGTADLPVIIDSRKILVDFKTSATINKMLTGVQLEAYAKAYESHGYHFDGKAILHLQAKGDYQWLYYDCNDSESWIVFTSLLNVYNHIQKYKGKR